MKKTLPFIFLWFCSLVAASQTDGLSYQAVIIDPNPQELPGVDAVGNILPNTEVLIQFTILDSQNQEEYQEIQQTTTDALGMIHLMIGQGEPTGLGSGDFTRIEWDGRPKSLQVAIGFEGGSGGFIEMNREELTFVPYSYHRNITARGTLTVDDLTFLNGELVVQGPTNLNSSLDVHDKNETNLSGPLLVEGPADLKDGLKVEGNTSLETLELSGNLTVEDSARFMGPVSFNAPTEFVDLTVKGKSSLEGQVTVRANLDSVGGDDTYGAYPLLVEGSKQGIAIKVTGIDNDDPNGVVDVPMSTENNFISFWDATENKMWGRIEGQSNDDLKRDPEHQWELGNRIADISINSIDAVIAVLEWGQGGLDLTAALTSNTACLGVGACVTLPVPSFIISKTANVILKVANIASVVGNELLAISELAKYQSFVKTNLGVTYQSGSGDYAEWLPKLNLNDQFVEGELVGVKNGRVTKNTWGVEKIMIVSTSPIILGNMPPAEEEANYVKIAFMGQVPVRIIGQAKAGDFLVPHEVITGFAKAVDPSEMAIMDYKKIAGVVWEIIGSLGENIQIVNAAVGINSHDLADVVNRQAEEIELLHGEYQKLNDQLAQLNAQLVKLVPGFVGVSGTTELKEPESEFSNNTLSTLTPNPGNIIYPTEEDVLYFEISDEQLEASLEVARENYQRMVDNPEMIDQLLSLTDSQALLAAQNVLTARNGENDRELVPLKDHPFWARIDSDPAYKEEVLQFCKQGVEKSFHTHRKHAHQFTHLKLKE